jgi:ribosomal protein S6
VNNLKLNHDLVRYTMLSIESSKNITGPLEDELLANLSNYGEYDRNQIAYTVMKLKEAKYITGDVQWGNNQPVIISPGNLTYEGHKFLDNIRDDGVWKDTKNILSKFSSVSLTLVSNVAAGVITQIIKHQMGI